MSFLVYDRWEVEVMQMREDFARTVWELLQGYPSLFSDKRIDEDGWKAFAYTPTIVWFGVYESGKLVGLMFLDFTDSKTDVETHLVFFDRKPAEKAGLCQALLVVAFRTFPRIVRLSTMIPDIYRHTWRLARKVGMKWEGTKRAAISIGGQQRDMYIYGILRTELHAIPRQSQRN